MLDNMKNIRFFFDINENETSSGIVLPENLSKEEKIIISDKFASFLTLLQTGNLMSLILHSIVEGGIINNDKIFTDLIIKKLLQNFLVETEEKPIITPSEAFVFKEKQ